MEILGKIVMRTIFLFVFATLLAGCASNSTDVVPPEYVRTDAANTAEPLFNWPVVVERDGASLTFYEPQVSTWKQYQSLEAWIAVSIEPASNDGAYFGVIQMEAKTAVDFAARKVRLYDKRVTDLSFPGVQGASLRRLAEGAREMLENMNRPVNLDLLLAAAADSESVRESAVKVDPPPIFYRSTRAVLLMIDGDPIHTPIQGLDDLTYVVNTNWDLFQVPSTGRYYLLVGDRWLGSSSLDETFEATVDLPASLGQLPDDGNWEQALASIDAKPWRARSVPEVVVSREPAELILTDGEPVLEQIAGTDLRYIENTTSDVFRYRRSWYYLVAGRWFRSAELDGEWEFATPNLPEDFSRIPSYHDKAHVLSSVPGTIEAQLAVAQSQVPVKARISRNTEVEVSYAGEPVFERILGTELYYGVNTSYDVVRFGDEYFVCYQGVWFVGASPTGPFRVSPVVPSAIYDIPVSHPLYHTTFVSVYEADEATVTTGYTSGYQSNFVISGSIVFGTGY